MQWFRLGVTGRMLFGATDVMAEARWSLTGVAGRTLFEATDVMAEARWSLTGVAGRTLFEATDVMAEARWSIPGVAGRSPACILLMLLRLISILPPGCLKLGVVGSIHLIKTLPATHV